MERLKYLLKNIGDFSDEEMRLTMSNISSQEYTKGHSLVKEGTISKSIFYINEGFVRTYQLIDGREKTISFGKPGQFIASINGLVSNSPSDENIETITPTEIITLDSEKLEYLKHRIPKIAFLTNKLFKEILDCKEKRIKDFINLNATERYRFFVMNNPDLAKVVSINHLASYLGAAPETISRVRSKIIF